MTDSTTGGEQIQKPPATGPEGAVMCWCVSSAAVGGGGVIGLGPALRPENSKVRCIWRRKFGAGCGRKFGVEGGVWVRGGGRGAA